MPNLYIKSVVIHTQKREKPLFCQKLNQYHVGVPQNTVGSYATQEHNRAFLFQNHKIAITIIYSVVLLNII